MISVSDFQGAVVLYNDSQQLIKGQAQDLIADQGVIKCARDISRALNDQGLNAILAPISEEAEQALTPYDPTRYLVFNLAEGLGGRLFEEARIAWLLETSGYHFTGSSGQAIALSTNKALTKSILLSNGLSTPAWWLFHTPEDISEEISYPFPLFVKPVAEDASIGIGNDSVVTNHKALRERVAFVLENYRQSALAEEFIDGREFNVATWGDPMEVLPLAEIDFRKISQPEEKIVNYAAKWLDDTYEFHHTPAICPADVSPDLARRLSNSALKALNLIGAGGYARVDFRVDQAGTPYILEINCNPDISLGAGFCNTVEKSGLNFEAMALKILSLARRPADVYYSTSSQS
jgi:D-alanine-D-alanine ligase